MVNKREDKKEMCFVIMPFSDPEGYEKGHFKKIYEQLFKPAIELAGYKPHREDDDRGSTLIQANIFDNLINAPMVLCDLSTNNPNVLYELGIRHAFDKPVVLVCEKGQSLIFDIAGVKATEYRKERLYDEVLEDHKTIAKAIEETRDSAKQFSFMKLVNVQEAAVTKGEELPGEVRINMMLNELYTKISSIEKSIGRGTSSSEEFQIDRLKNIYLNRQLFSKLAMAEDALNRFESSGREADKYVLLALDKELGTLISEASKLDMPPHDIHRAIDMRRMISEKL